MYSQVKGDGKSYKFLSSRTHKAHMLKRNPRKITWTVLYRRYYSNYSRHPSPIVWSSGWLLYTLLYVPL